MLEGDVVALNALFETIQCDPRHGRLVVLENAPISERILGQWAMAHVGRSAYGERMFGAISHASGFDASTFDGMRVSRIMKDLLLREEHDGDAT